jgi:hypothetical protein
MTDLKINFSSKLFLAFLFASLLIVSACNPDDDDIGDLPPTGDPTELSGNQNTPLLLENIYSDPTAVDYIVTGHFNINAAVEVEPGVNIMVVAGRRITVGSGGSFNAEGTAQMPIRIFGEQAVKGYWDYLRFDGSNNPSNRLIHVHFADGGGDSFRESMVYLNGNSQVTIQNSTFDNSARNGLQLNDTDCRIPDFSNNRFDNCDLYPISLRSLYQAGSLDGNTEFVGNNINNAITIAGSSISLPFSLAKLQGPLLLNGTTNVNADMSIVPGAIIHMGPGARINIGSTGSLNAIGTAGERITIRGAVQTEGYFDYVRFDNSNNPLNEFRFVDVSYGGGDSFRDAAVFVGGNALFTMGNSSVNYSARYGICGSSGFNFVNDGNNVFLGNQLGDICD